MVSSIYSLTHSVCVYLCIVERYVYVIMVGESDGISADSNLRHTSQK